MLIDEHRHNLLNHIRRVAHAPDCDALTDGQLLEHFLAHQDESSFEAILRRHGPMVMGVCRRLLSDENDAEDAFQATFLVLVRKARSIVPREKVGNWLYGVACNTARRARAAKFRRQRRERQMEQMPQVAALDRNSSDLAEVLDLELEKLPERFRLPIVLCDLESRSRSEVARQLKIPEGTLSSRLARGRRKLAQRLSKHGIAFSGGALAVMLSQSSVSAGVPSSLLFSTVEAAHQVGAGQTATCVVSARVMDLTDGVVKSMFLSKLKTASVILVATLFLAVSAGFLVRNVEGNETLRGRSNENGGKQMGPVVVKIEHKVANADARAVDATPRVRIGQGRAFYIWSNEENGRKWHGSHFPCFKVDNRIYNPALSGRLERKHAPLPKSPDGRPRTGIMNIMRFGDLRITQMVEAIATNTIGPDGKRQCDAALIKYIIENKGRKPHKVAVRTYMDTYVMGNDACLFAAPNRPGKILDGYEFKTVEEVPDYLMLLERPDRENPGYVTHLTFNLGADYERPNRLVLTNYHVPRHHWILEVAPVGKGDSALAFWWAAKEIPPGGNRTLAYTYGKGIGSPLRAIGSFDVKLGGSFEKGKVFTISAVVNDPASGQFLQLMLAKGMTLIDGRVIQPVPAQIGGKGQCLVLWKGRVEQNGRHEIRVRSSHGVTRTVIVTITP